MKVKLKNKINKKGVKLKQYTLIKVMLSNGVFIYDHTFIK